MTSGTRDKFQSRPFCRKPPEGSWKRTMDRHTHGEYSIAEHSPCPATEPQELKRHPSAHTAPPGARSCPPSLPQGSPLPTGKKCHGPDSTHCTGSVSSWSLALRAHIDNSSQKPPWHKEKSLLTSRDHYIRG